MRIYFLIFGFLFSNWVLATDPVTKIAKANEAKKQAEKAFQEGNYQQAITQYSYLIDSLNYKDEAALLNRAHSYYQLKDTLKAFEQYREASVSQNAKIKSTALNQLGALSEQQEQLKEGLDFYKEALRTDPTNKQARYNYELLKKKLQKQEEEKRNKDQENKDQNEENQEEQQQDQENQQQDKDAENQKEQQEQKEKKEGEESEEQQDKENAEDKNKSDDEKKGEEQKEGEEKEQQEDAKQDSTQMPPSTKQKLEEMNVSEEKAKMILEALRNKEAQYLQQMRKKATKRNKSNKPDW